MTQRIKDLADDAAERLDPWYPHIEKNPTNRWLERFEYKGERVVTFAREIDHPFYAFVVTWYLQRAGDGTEYGESQEVKAWGAVDRAGEEVAARAREIIDGWNLTSR